VITIAEFPITCNNENFILTNQRALFWEKEQALVLSDLHVGKSATFRKAGIPISKNVLKKDLDRLAHLIGHFRATKLIVVGDLFHAEHNLDIIYFETWLSSFKNLNIELILGNHDRLNEKQLSKMSLKVFQPKKTTNNLCFVHDAKCDKNALFSVSGHTHPGVIIKGKARQHIKLPCYQVTKNQLILPAFSLFTGLNYRDCPKNCKNIAFTEDLIFEV
tara:strand:- start:79 stop:732 length:654 start_codon:yes stop_codon:yes gene_type:complete